MFIFKILLYTHSVSEPVIIDWVRQFIDGKIWPRSQSTAQRSPQVFTAGLFLVMMIMCSREIPLGRQKHKKRRTPCLLSEFSVTAGKDKPRWKGREGGGRRGGGEGRATRVII